MSRLDTSKCGLCIDPAHLIQAGSDPEGRAKQAAKEPQADTRPIPEELKAAAE